MKQEDRIRKTGFEFFSSYDLGAKTYIYVYISGTNETYPPPVD